MYIDYVVDVSSINEYLYCTRRAYYSIFYGDRDINYYLTDGKIKHKNRSKDSKMYNEFFLESRHLGLRGKIDILDYRHTIVPVESKRGVKYYENDEMQLAAYCMLLNDCFGLNVEFGYIYLYGTNKRYKVLITDYHIDKVNDVVNDIRNMQLYNTPDFTHNKNKCSKCSFVAYCMPFETKMLR